MPQWPHPEAGYSTLESEAGYSALDSAQSVGGLSRIQAEYSAKDSNPAESRRLILLSIQQNILLFHLILQAGWESNFLNSNPD